MLIALALLAALAAGGSPRPQAEVTLVAVGDLQLGRGVGRSIEAEGVEYPFRAVRALLDGADIAFGNLECALSKEAKPIPKRYSFKADPEAARGLAWAGFDVLSLANNHSLDCGRRALAETTEALRAHGLLPVGAAENAQAAAAPLIMQRRGLRVAFLARTMFYPEGVIYREDAPTVAVLDPEHIEQEIRAACERADIVVVSLHWGIEYARQPQEEQRRLARRLIDAGASLVLGHHPHTPQPVERYRGGVIAYSLGNFVFDAASPHAREGLAFRCVLTRNGIRSAEAPPVLIHQGQPHLLPSG
jgi:poly-gamma-glutamate synthesis protein (capsule biosynthesis protein)